MEKENQIIINCLCGNKVKIEDEGKCKSCAIKGKNNPMYGVHRFGNTNPMYGKHYISHRLGKKCSEETKLNMKKAWIIRKLKGVK